MPEVDLNYWAIVVGAVVSFVIGMVWFRPSVFGNAWMEAMGKTAKELEPPKEKIGQLMAGAAVGGLVLSYILAHFVDYTGAKTIAEGAQTGFWLWLGFVAPFLYVNSSFEGRTITYWYVTAGNQLVTLVVIGSILAVWA